MDTIPLTPSCDILQQQIMIHIHKLGAEKKPQQPTPKLTQQCMAWGGYTHNQLLS